MGKRKAITQKMLLAFAKEWGAFPCVDCQRTGHHELYAWTEIQRDHDLALIDGGKHSAKALVPRCIPHHKIKSAREHRENCRAKRLKAGPKPSKKPMRHPTLRKRMDGTVVRREP